MCTPEEVLSPSYMPFYPLAAPRAYSGNTTCLLALSGETEVITSRRACHQCRAQFASQLSEQEGFCTRLVN